MTGDVVRYILVALLATFVACKQSPLPVGQVRIPNGWVSVAPPAPESEEATCANWARDEYDVSLEIPGTLTISKMKRHTVHIVELARGTFVAVNRGEFGGDVRWEGNDGQTQTVADTNLVAFLRTPTGLLGLVGIAHLGISQGSIVEFASTPDGWRMKPWLALPAAPYAVWQAVDGTLDIVLSTGLAIVRSPRSLEIAHHNVMWGRLYPNSIVKDGAGIRYVGMRGAVARLSPAGDGLREDWLVPADCTHRRRVGSFGCECDGR